MNPMMLNLMAVLPEVVILTAASIILLVDLFLPDNRRHVSYWLTQFALLLALCITLKTMHVDAARRLLARA